MEKKVLYGFVVMLIYLIDGGFSQVQWISEEAKWEQFLDKSQLPIVATVTSSLCGVPCAILEEQVAQLAKKYSNQFIFYKADILEKPFFVKLYKVLNIPTVIVFKDGEEIKRLANEFYWGSLYDLIFNQHILSSAPSPSEFAPPPSEFAEPPSSVLVEELLRIRDEFAWEKTLAETLVPIVVTVTSSSYGAPCAILVDQVTQLAKIYSNQIIFYLTDILEKPFFAKLYNVVNVPTVLVFKDGKKLLHFDKTSDWGIINDLQYYIRAQ